MSIRVQDLLEQKARKFGTNRESAQFQQILIDAINYTLDDLENKAGVTNSRISRISDTIDLDQQGYQGVISIGVDYYMQDNQLYNIQSSDRILQLYMDKIRTSRDVYLRAGTINGRAGDTSGW